MAKPRKRRTVREELSEIDSAHGEETMSEFHDNTATEAGDPQPAKTAAPRLSLPLTDDGTAIDWDRVRDAEKARRIVGLGADTKTSATSELFGSELIGVALDSLSMVAVAMARANGYRTEAADVLRFTTDEKATLVPRIEKVLAKYAPTLGEYEDEIALAATAGMIVVGKVVSLRRSATVTEFPKPVEEQS